MTDPITKAEYAEAKRQLVEEAERRAREGETPEHKKARMQLMTEADQAAIEAERQADFDALPGYERAFIAFDKSLADTGHALGDLVGLDKYDEQFFDDKARRDDMLMSDPAAMAGYVGGKVAELAVPTGALAQGIKTAATHLPNALRAVKGGESLVRNLKSVGDLAKEAKYLRRVAPFVSRAAPVVAAEAIVGGLDTPGGLGERAQGAAWGVAGATAGEAIGTGLRHAVTHPSKLNPFNSQWNPFRSNPTEEAERLVAQGVDVPPWQMREKGLARRLTDALRGTWFSRGVIEETEEIAQRQWNQNLIDAARPPTPVKNDAGEVIRWENTTGPVSTRPQIDLARAKGEAINQLKDEFNEAYEIVYAGKTMPVDNVLTDELAFLQAQTRSAHPAVADDTVAKIQSVLDRFLVGVDDVKIKSPIVGKDGEALVSGVIPARGASATGVKEALGEVDRLIKNSDSDETREALFALKQILSDFRMRGLDPGSVDYKTLQEINAAYRNFIPIQDAFSSNKAITRGMVSPNQLLTSLRKQAPNKQAFSTYQHPMKDVAEDASRVIGPTIPEMGPGTMEKMLLPTLLGGGLSAMAGFGSMDAATAALLYGALSRPGRKALAGRQPWQKSLAARPPRVAPALRAAGRPIGTLQAQPDEENQ